MLGIHARTKHAIIVRQRARHTRAGSIATRAVEIDAPIGSESAILVQTIWQREIVQSRFAKSPHDAFRQWTKIFERWTKRCLFWKFAKTHALQSRIRFCCHSGKSGPRFLGTGRVENAAILGSRHYGVVITFFKVIHRFEGIYTFSHEKTIFLEISNANYTYFRVNEFALRTGLNTFVNNQNL